jgi:hypothetical protein
MSNTYPTFADMEKQREENKKNFEKNVPDSLYSEYKDLRDQLKQIKPRKEAELKAIHKKYDAERNELRLKAGNSVKKMSELTGISTWDLNFMVGGYHFND